MQNPVISREEAKAMGFTHEGYMMGIPVWFVEIEENDYRFMAKIIFLTRVVEFLDGLFEDGCRIFWRFNPDIVFEAPFTIKGEI